MNKTIVRKLAHSSILIKHRSKRILIDPGVFSKQELEMHGVDILIITHLHGDHYHEANIKYIIKHNPALTIITNTEVARKLNEQGIEALIVEGNSKIEISGINIEAHDHPHEEIYGDFGQVQNTGYYIDEVFFHPGDAFTSPNQKVKAIATVIIAPFMRVKMAINYMNANPDAIHIGVHDSVASSTFAGFLKNIISKNLASGVRYEHPADDNLDWSI